MQKLSRAISENNLLEVNRLLQSGYALDEADAVSGKTPLMQAVEQEDVRLMELLLLYGASVHAEGSDGWTPLHLAVDIAIDATIQSNGKKGTEPVSVIALLLEYSADMQTQTVDGLTPLDIARQYGSSRIIRYLSNREKLRYADVDVC